MTSLSTKSSSDNGHDRMQMLLSVMEGYSGAESELSSSAHPSFQRMPVNGDDRSFSASPPISSLGHEEAEQQTIVTPPASHRMQMIPLATPNFPTVGVNGKQSSFSGHFRTTNNGLKSLLMASAKPLQGYSDLEKHFSQGSSTPAEASSNNSTGSQLHNLCRSLNSQPGQQSSAMASILKADCMAVRRSCQLERPIMNLTSLYRHERQPYEPYTLPLNLALLHHDEESWGETEALKLLAEAGPDVLTLADGPNQCGSLSIDLSHHPHNLELVQLLLKANPSCAMVTDQRQNLPLHVACLRGAPLSVVRQVYFANPRALYEPNWNGDTPYHIVQRNPTLISSAVSDFFFAVTARRERRKRQQASQSTTRR